jgi:hemerythrin-like domain-containing protein
MLVIVKKELDVIARTKVVNPVFIDTVVDFIRVYADRTHHGKEEDILFKQLENKKMNADDTKMMQELVDEHVSSRKLVGELVEANKKYAKGDLSAMKIITERLSFLIDFYPKHIAKEDLHFFPNTEKYFSKEELETMLDEFWEFDRKMIHEKYIKLYESLEKNYTW